VKSLFRNILIVCVFFGAKFQAQIKTCDSLIAILASKKADTSSLSLLNQNLIKIYQKDELDTCLFYGLKAIALCDSSNAYIARTYNIVANCYNVKGVDDLVTKYYFLALKIYERQNNLVGTANIYNNLGNLYNKQKYYSEALDYHYRALAIRKKINEPYYIAFSHNNIANVLYSQKKLTTALTNYLAAYKIYEDLDDTTVLITVLNNLGGLYPELKKNKEAEESLLKALRLNNSYGFSKPEMAISYINLSRLYLRTNRLNEAEVYGLKAVQLSEELENAESKINAYGFLGDIYKMQNNYKMALIYYEKKIEFKDSIYNEEINKKIVSEKLQYEYDKKEETQKIEQATKEAEFKLGQKKQSQITWLLIAILLVVIAFAVFFFINFKQKQRTNFKIGKQNQIIKEKQKEVIDSINYAKRIQTAILPREDAFVNDFDDAFVFYKPRDIISGDLYWYAKLSTTSDSPIPLKVVAVADCTGHGVPGAFMSLLTTELLNQSVKNPDINSPSELLQHINRQITKRLNENNKEVINDGLDIAVCAIDYERNRVFYSGANRSLWILRADVVEEIKPTKASIGASTPIDQNFENHIIQLNKGDKLFLFTDGITDQFGGFDHKRGSKKFGKAQLKQFITDNAALSLKEMGEKFEKHMRQWQGLNEQTDDMLLIGLAQFFT
jgi:serine phosphatase RsbU (regulator of sigma subunit)